jgi:aerobic carbon-monoxide dehydrogenase medium subunit
MSSKALPFNPAQLSPTRLLTPATLDEAMDLLHGAAPLGGGVGLSLARRAGHRRQALVAVAHLPRLSGVWRIGSHIVIGAGTRLAELENEPTVVQAWPAVADAAGGVATARIRRLVTLGGNLAANDETHDPPVALAAVGATMTIRGPAGTRTVPTTAVGDVGQGDLITDVRLPAPSRRLGSAYEKFLVRGVWEYACVNVAAVAELGEDDRLADLRVAVGSVEGGPVLIALDDLQGQPVSDGLIAECGRRSGLVNPRDDAKASAVYKKHMITEFTQRAVRTAVARAGAR